MNIQVEVLDFEADATAEQVFLKRPPNFLGGESLPKVDATAQQAFLKGPSDL